MQSTCDQEEFNSKLCVICQSSGSECLVNNPLQTSYISLCEKLLQRLEWEDEFALTVVSRLGGKASITGENLKRFCAKWHRNCYQQITHKKNCEILKKKFEERSAEIHNASVSVEKPFTRSSTDAYKKTLCIFCDQEGTRRNVLRTVAYDSAGKNLKKAAELSNDQKLLVRISAAVTPGDAHAIDVSYHAVCWAKNVNAVLRKHEEKSTALHVAAAASEIEFLKDAEELLFGGGVQDMGILEKLYREICSSNNVPETWIKSRKQLKSLLETQLCEEGIEFSKPRKVNEPYRVSVKTSRDAALRDVECKADQTNQELTVLIKAAEILRKHALNAPAWHFNGSFEDAESSIPEEMFFFFKWCFKGKSSELTYDPTINFRAKIASQQFMASCFTDRQAQRQTALRRQTKEYPHQAAMGLAIHKETRSRSLIDLFYSFNLSVNYKRVLRMEMQIAAAVVQDINANAGVYVPPNIVLKRPIYCAADNCDFQEDTPDGKHTLHGVIMVVYQACNKNDTSRTLELPPATSSQQLLNNYASSVLDVDHCYIAKNFKFGALPRTLPTTKSDSELLLHAEQEDIAWLSARMVAASSFPAVDNADQRNKEVVDKNIEEHKDHNLALTWAGHYSLVSKKVCKMTRVGVLPLIPHACSERSTQLTFMRKLEKLTETVMGEKTKAIVTLDMALYKAVKQLEAAKPEWQGRWVLRPGELHIFIAMLRTIGTFCDCSGVPQLWMESGVYGANTIKQVLDGKHVRRGIEAHLTTWAALNTFYQEEFYTRHPELQEVVKASAVKLSDAWNSQEQNVVKAHSSLLNIIQTEKIAEKMKAFDLEQETKHPLFKATCLYMAMVQTMLTFIRSVRTANWRLHISSLHEFTKYFFALDRPNYARMIPLYLSEMKQLEETSPEIAKEFMSGNWGVHKSFVPFCALGSDEALEHENRRLKVQGGIVGLTQNENALLRFFLTAPELARIADETKQLAGGLSHERSKHHQLSPSICTRYTRNIKCLEDTIKSFTNPFSWEHDELINFVTNKVMSPEIVRDVTRVAKVGEELHENFVRDRIASNNVPFWDPIKRNNLKLFRSSGKKVKMQLHNNVTEVKEDRKLFSKLLVACRARPELDLKQYLSKYEFTVSPRSLFAADGTMLHCTPKSALLGILQKVSEDKRKEKKGADLEETSREENLVQMKVAVLDGMAILHCLDKPASIINCSQLSDHFNKKLSNTYKDFHEVHLIFDTYKADSLKAATRTHRQSSTGDPVHYKISSTCVIKNVTMKRLLSHDLTKNELAEYLAKGFIAFGKTISRNFVVAWGMEAIATHIDIAHLCSTHEEADTKLILHALDARNRNASELHIFSSDTDVLVLALRRAPLLPKKSFVKSVGNKKTTFNIQEIFLALGPLKASALPGFHALSGADITGGFYGKGKKTWWKAFSESSEETLLALTSLGSTEAIDPAVLQELEKLVCRVYVPSTKSTNVEEVRWLLFTKKHAQSEQLPPTKASLHPALKRAHLQARIWAQDDKAHPQIPNPTSCGWIESVDEGRLVPVTCTLPPAPQAIMELITCSCKKSRCALSCKCRKQKLACTEMCACRGEEDFCDNGYISEDSEPENESSDDDHETDI